MIAPCRQKYSGEPGYRHSYREILPHHSGTACIGNWQGHYRDDGVKGQSLIDQFKVGCQLGCNIKDG